MSAPAAAPHRTISQFCDHVCMYVRFRPDHEAITAELTAHLEDHKAAILETRPDMPLREAERRAVEAMGNPEELGRWLDSIHNPLLGWLQIWFVRAVVLAGVLMLLFSVPRLGTVAVNLLAPPTYNSLGGLGSALERSAPEEIVVDFRPEGSWTWEGYTFSIHRAVVLDLGDEQALYYLLKVTHPNPWNREPALRDWLWAEDDLGNFYPSYRQGRLLIEQGYSTMDFGESSGNPSASYPFASYYDLWVSGIDPSATEITLGSPFPWKEAKQMARRPMTPARRKRRTIRMAIALPILLAVLVLVLDYPILTAGQALRATQKRYFFGPGEVLTSIDFSRGYNKFKIGQSDRYYILRWGDWYAWCSVNHYGLFWQSGALDAVENDPSLPLVPLVVSDWAEGAVLVVCNDPDIARVEIEFPVFTYSGSDLLATAVQDQHTADCFLIRWDLEEAVWLYPEDLRVRGYAADGTLIYQSPLPESWAEDYSIPDPDNWRFRYEALYPGEVGS